jgi:predicted transcriptional regulator
VGGLSANFAIAAMVNPTNVVLIIMPNHGVRSVLRCLEQEKIMSFHKVSDLIATERSFRDQRHNDPAIGGQL